MTDAEAGREVFRDRLPCSSDGRSSGYDVGDLWYHDGRAWCFLGEGYYGAEWVDATEIAKQLGLCKGQQ